MSWGASTDHRWVLTDRYGRAWRLALGKPRAPISPMSRATGPAAVVDGLVSDAFAPWGTATRETTASLLQIYRALGAPDVAREHLHRRRGETGWRHRLETIRAALLRAVDSGWLRCEPMRQLQQGVEDAAPDTTREPLLPEPETTTWFELRVVDETGEPVPDLEVAFGIGANRRIVSTDGRGIARLEDGSRSSVSAAVASVARLRERLAPRWREPRAPSLPVGPNVHVAELDAATRSLPVEAETPTTLAVRPLFRCNELSGAYFAFARSFVLQSAIDTLSMIAASVLQDDCRKAMIFGHTDTAGSEALNKELSERRAKSVFAILTHDADIWEELWTGSADGSHFKEQWGYKEAQHLLNALGIPDDDGNALVEDGLEGKCTRAALKRFQRGDYPNARKARGPLPETGKPDRATRKEFLLSFAERVTRDPVPAARFSLNGGAPFMGCGEYNPLSEHARDDASRRTVVFVFDAAAEPQRLPCQLRNIGPCKTIGGVDEPLPDVDGKPYRCQIYREIAKPCPCVKGEELMHLELQLHDRSYQPTPDTPYRIVLGGVETAFGKTDSEGVLHAAVRKSELAIRVTYHPANESRPLTIEATVFPPDELESDRELVRKIRNLGFGARDDSDGFAIRKFQEAHKNLKRTGKLDDQTKQAIRDLDDQELRDVFDDEVG